MFITVKESPIAATTLMSAGRRAWTTEETDINKLNKLS